MSMRDSSLHEAERELRARVHKRMGITAAVLGIIAAGVGFWWINRAFGVKPWEALVSALPLFGLVVALLALAALVSLGAARLAYFAERRAHRSSSGKQTDT